MSADNFYLIDYRPELNPINPFCAIHGFKSNGESLEPGAYTSWFRTIGEATAFGNNEYTEYGTSWTPAAAKNQLVNTGLQRVDTASKTDYDRTPGGNMADIKATAWETTIDGERYRVAHNIDAWERTGFIEVENVDLARDLAFTRKGLGELIRLLQHAYDSTEEEEEADV